MADILSNLRYAQGSRKKKKRIGRGQGSGHGGTSTRGHKGQGSRSGSGLKRNFEGGQMPLVRRLPKFGFTPVHRVEYAVVNVSLLEKLVETKKVTDGVITPDVLRAIGVVSDKKSPVKVLGDGDLKSKLSVTAHKFSKTAAEKIAAAGGTVTEIVSGPAPAKQS
ncbi:MAG: 50S ribosomal protein L15 [Bacteroidetes bacterium]|nr:MAG: 50S ribosomal protein L15 [Bacteroidota bacterium]